MMGMPSEPIVGDRVMCLRNNSQAGLFNGMQGTIGELFENDFMLFSSDDHQSEVCFDREVFGQVKYDFDHDRDSPMPFDYCYATTCHKCQGSQYDSVLVMEQRCDLWDHKRWAYTAASRAINKLYWCEF
jgi:exodeoxyribonuclease-5